jgi:hypothetical protein
MILAGSLTIFFVNVRRETTHRAQRRLTEWGERNGFWPTDLEAGPPPPLDRLSGVPLELKISLSRRHTRLVHCRSAPNATHDVAEHWNLAIRRITRVSPAPVGLRSAEDARSIVDLFGLNLAPHQPTSSRFTIVGEDMLATRALADGSTQSLLPGDLSLLRIDDYLVIDFSDRPFDELELGRMVAVLDQLAAIA